MGGGGLGMGWGHFNLYLTPMTLTFNLPEKMFQMALLLLKDNNCAKLFWNPCINVQVMAWTSPIYDHFDLYLTPVTLTFILPEINVSNGTSPPWGQQLCKVILKSMHKCTSYGPDKLNIWLFWPLFDPCDLDLQPTRKKASNGTSPPRSNNLQSYFEIHA